MNYQDLRTALTIASGTLTIARDTAGGSLAGFLDACYGGQPLVISNAALGSQDDVNQTMVVAGTADFLGATGLPVTARFYVDNTGQVQALLKYQLRDGAPPSTAWTLAQSFPSLPTEWNYATGYNINDSGDDLTGLQTSYVGSLNLLNTYFVVSSCAGQDPDVAVPLLPGNNLVSQFVPNGMAGLFESVLTSTPPLTLYGPIQLPQGTAAVAPLADNQFPWQRLDAPGIDLYAPLSLNFTMGNVVLDQVGLRIYSPLSTDWQAANISFAPIHGYTARLSIPSASIQAELTAVLEWNLPRAFLVADCHGLTLGKLADLIDLAGTGTLSSLLPDSLRTAADNLGQLQLMNIALSLSSDGTTPTVDSVSVKVGLPSVTWTVWGDLLQVGDITCTFDIPQPFSSSGTGSSGIVATVEGTLTIEGVSLLVGARSDASFSLYAKLEGQQTIPLASLMRDFAPGIPAPASLTIDSLSVNVTPGTSYSMSVLMGSSPPWSIPLGPTALTIGNVGLTLAHGAQGGTTGSFSGHVGLGNSLDFDMNYTIPGQFSLAGQLPTVNLSSLVSTLTGGSIALPGFDLSFTTPAVQINSDGTNYSLQLGAPLTMGSVGGMVAFEVMKVGSTWGYAAGLSLQTGSLSGLGGLSALSAFESIFPFKNIVLVACSAVPSNFNFPALSQFNSPALSGQSISIPGTPAIQAGFNAYATFNLSGSTQLKMLKKVLNSSSTMTLALNIGTNPAQQASLTASMSGNINSGTTLTGALTASLSQSGVQMGLQASVATKLQGQPCVFTGLLSLTPTACDLSATMQGSLTFSGITLSNLSFEVGVDTALVPSIGVAASIAVQNFNSSIAIFFDSGNPAQSLFAGAVSNLSLRDVVDTLAGGSGIIPAALDQALAQVSLQGTNSFTIPAASAANVVTALNNRTAATVSTAFKNYGNVTIPSSNTNLLIVRGKTGTWFITDLKNIQHYQVTTNSGGGLKVSLEAQVYCAPQATTIGALQFPQGFSANGKLNFFGFSVTANISISQAKGISATASMSKISIGNDNLFSLRAAQGTGGPQLSVCTYTDNTQTDPTLKSPHFLLNCSCTFLGATASAYINLSSSGLLFNINLTPVSGMSLAISGSFTSPTQLSVKGTASFTLSGTLDFGALGTISINQAVSLTVAAAVAGSTISASLSGSLTVYGRNYSINIGFDVTTGQISQAASLVLAQLKSLINGIYGDMVSWMNDVKGGIAVLANGATQFGQTMAQVYHQTSDQIGSYAKNTMNYGQNDVAKALQGGGATATQAGQIMYGLYGDSSVVTSALSSAFTNTHADYSYGVHADSPSRTITPHGDTGHQDSHSGHDDAHWDLVKSSHTDTYAAHWDIGHTDVPHGDIPHGDSTPHTDTTV